MAPTTCDALRGSVEPMGRTAWASGGCVVALLPGATGTALAADLWTDGGVSALHARGTTLYAAGTFSRVGVKTGGVAVTDAEGRPRDERTPRGTSDVVSVTAATGDGAGGWWIAASQPDGPYGAEKPHLRRLRADGTLDGAADVDFENQIERLERRGTRLFAVTRNPSGYGYGKPRIVAVDVDGSGPVLSTWSPKQPDGAEVTARGPELMGRVGLALDGDQVVVATQARTYDDSTRTCTYTLYVDAVDAVTGASRWHRQETRSGECYASPQDSGVADAVVGQGQVVVAWTLPPTSAIERPTVLRAFDAGDGSVAPALPQPQGPVEDLAVDGATLYLGGALKDVGGAPRAALAAVDLTSRTVLPWAPPAVAVPNGYGDHFSERFSVQVLGDRIVAGGFRFRATEGIDNGRIAAYRKTDGARVPFAAILAPTPPWSVPVAAGGGDVLVTGPFAAGRTTRRAGIAAFRARDGALLPFDPETPDAAVRTLTTSPDGSTLYAGGDFNAVGEAPRGHVAAFAAASGALRPFRLDTDGSVLTLVATADRVIAGGTFRNAGGSARRFLAAGDATTGDLLSWDPALDLNEKPSSVGTAGPDVRTLALQGRSLYVGGAFLGPDRYTAAAVDACTAALLPWRPRLDSRSVDALSLAGDRVVLTGAITVAAGRAARGFVAARTDGSGTTEPLPFGPAGFFDFPTASVADGTTILSPGQPSYDLATDETGPVVPQGTSIAVTDDGVLAVAQGTPYAASGPTTIVTEQRPARQHPTPTLDCPQPPALPVTPSPSAPASTETTPIQGQGEPPATTPTTPTTPAEPATVTNARPAATVTPTAVRDGRKVRVGVRCSAACRVRGELRAGRRVLGTVTARRTSAGPLTLRFTLRRGTSLRGRAVALHLRTASPAGEFGPVRRQVLRVRAAR